VPVAELVSSVLAEPEAPVSGPVLFARYACPPNQHGYCGPADADSFFSSGVTGNETDLRARARDFDGALPFLQLIAEAADRADPLDPAVVEAYWLGGPALDQAGPASAANRPRAASGPLFASLGAAARAGAVPHHSFVVFCVYPWVVMLGDARRTPQAMRVLDGCRIRWGRVLEVSGDTVTAASEPLVWDGQQLGYGATAVEKVRRAIDGRGLASPLTVGDAVALHWDWVCDRISENQQRVLQDYSARHLALVNQVLAGRGVGR
jgi:Family of unknown function (DUF6390)